MSEAEEYLEKKECYNCKLDISASYPKTGIVESGELKNNFSVIFSFCSNKCFQEFEVKRKKDSQLSKIFDFVTVAECQEAVSLARKEAREQTMKNCLEGIATEKVLRLWCSDCQKFTKVSHNPKHTTTKIYEHLLSKFTTEVEVRVREENEEAIAFFKHLKNHKEVQEAPIHRGLPVCKLCEKSSKEILDEEVKRNE